MGNSRIGDVNIDGVIFANLMICFGNSLRISHVTNSIKSNMYPRSIVYLLSYILNFWANIN